MSRKVILVPNLMYSKYYMVVQCNIIQRLNIIAGLSQWHHGHAVITTVVWV